MFAVCSVAIMKHKWNGQLNNILIEIQLKHTTNPVVNLFRSWKIDAPLWIRAKLKFDAAQLICQIGFRAKKSGLFIGKRRKKLKLMRQVNIDFHTTHCWKCVFNMKWQKPHWCTVCRTHCERESKNSHFQSRYWTPEELTFIFGFVNVFSGMHTSFVCVSASGIMQATEVGRKRVSPTVSKSLHLLAPFGMFKINHWKQHFHFGIFPSNYSTVDFHLTYYLPIFAATTIYHFRGRVFVCSLFNWIKSICC